MNDSHLAATLFRCLDDYLEGRASADGLRDALFRVTWNTQTTVDAALRHIAYRIQHAIYEYTDDGLTRDEYLERLVAARDDLARHLREESATTVRSA